jgi:hypothetical protein
MEGRLFPETVRARVPRGLPAAVAAAARRRCTTPSEWMRQGDAAQPRERGHPPR